MLNPGKRRIVSGRDTFSENGMKRTWLVQLDSSPFTICKFDGSKEANGAYTKVIFFAFHDDTSADLERH